MIQIILKFLIECHSLNLPDSPILLDWGCYRPYQLGLHPASAPAPLFLYTVALDVDLVLVQAALQLSLLQLFLHMAQPLLPGLLCLTRGYVEALDDVASFGDEILGLDLGRGLEGKPLGIDTCSHIYYITWEGIGI